MSCKDNNNNTTVNKSKLNDALVTNSRALSGAFKEVLFVTDDSNYGDNVIITYTGSTNCEKGCLWQWCYYTNLCPASYTTLHYITSPVL